MKISPCLLYLSHYPGVVTSAALSCFRVDLVITERMGKIACFVHGLSKVWVEKPWCGL